MNEAAALPHPLRRLLAYWIDKVCAWVLLGLLMAVSGLDSIDTVVSMPSKDLSVGFAIGMISTEFRPFITLGTSTCGTPSPELQAALSQMVEGKVTEAQACLSRIFGVFVAGRTDVSVTAPDGAIRTAVIPLNPKGLFSLVDLYAAFILLVFGWLGLATTRRTPGKWLMGLKVTGSPQAKLAREAIRLSPILAMLALGSGASLLATEVPALAAGWMQWGLLGIALLVPIGLWLWLWLKPLMAEVPYIPWDRWTGCRLSQGKDEPPPDLPF